VAEAENLLIGSTMLHPAATVVEPVDLATGLMLNRGGLATGAASTDMPGTDAEVVECYRLLLDREPENQDAISAKSGLSLYAVVVDILDSDEFMARNLELFLHLFY
jgi:hypothetical protein